MTLPDHLPAAADFWESRWQAGQTNWDLRAVSPPLQAYCDQLSAEQRAGAVLIPGCGNGHEALYLLEHGFSKLTLLDVAPTAIEALRQRLEAEGPPDWSARLRLVCADFFMHEGQYDLILEQTFFCALDPVFRESYVHKMYQLLRTGGRLVGLLFDRTFEGGPPYGGNRAEYEALFSTCFRIQTLAPCYNSATPRAGTELFFNLQKTHEQEEMGADVAPERAVPLL